VVLMWLIFRLIVCCSIVSVWLMLVCIVRCIDFRFMWWMVRLLSMNVFVVAVVGWVDGIVGFYFCCLVR